MKICAVTMVYRDYWALAQWYGHYTRLVGSDNLYIVAHGHDARVQEICPDASVVAIPRTDLTGFDAFRARILNKLQATLLEVYDWVVRTDADELICVDPAIANNLEALLATQDAPALFALGLELVEMRGDAPIVGDERALAVRKHAKVSGHYSKAWAVSRPENLVRHGVQMRPNRTRWFPFALPDGVYLVHVKYANRCANADANRARMEVANGPETGLPGKAWRDANADAENFYIEFDDLPERSWERTIEEALERVRKSPERNASEGLVRARKLQFNHRTELPDWFSNY